MTRSVSVEDKTRIDVECVCPVCALAFTIHGIDQYLSEVGSGYDIGNLECPNCCQKGLRFDLFRVKDNGFVAHHRKQVHDEKAERMKERKSK